MNPNWEEVQFKYPVYSLRLRRDVIEWINERGGKKFLRKLIYNLYNKVVARHLISSRRKHHKKQFKAMRSGHNDKE